VGKAQRAHHYLFDIRIAPAYRDAASAWVRRIWIDAKELLQSADRHCALRRSSHAFAHPRLLRADLGAEPKVTKTRVKCDAVSATSSTLFHVIGAAPGRRFQPLSARLQRSMRIKS
jgi:hypothetical protein